MIQKSQFIIEKAELDKFVKSSDASHVTFCLYPSVDSDGVELRLHPSDHTGLIASKDGDIYFLKVKFDF